MLQKISAKDAPALARLQAYAYPGGDPGEMEKGLAESLQNPHSLFGVYRDGVLVGSMRHLDYTLSLRGTKVAAGGVGGVAVDFLHKKERVAKELLQGHLAECRARGQHLACLYPFNPSFYHKMGYGYGVKLYEYRIEPRYFPKGEKGNLRYLTKQDLPALLDCYNREAARINGTIFPSQEMLKHWVCFPNVAVGVWEDDCLVGYTIFRFLSRGQELCCVNDIQVQQLCYTNLSALHSLCAFFHSQQDQIGLVILKLPDPDFYHLLAVPHNGGLEHFQNFAHEVCTQGLSTLYRVTDTEKLFSDLKDARFGQETVTVRFVVKDDFLPENDRPVTVRFEQGRPSLSSDEPDVTLTLGVAQLSSLLLGSVSLQKLIIYGLAQISHSEQAETLSRLFASDAPVACAIAF